MGTRITKSECRELVCSKNFGAATAFHGVRLLRRTSKLFRTLAKITMMIVILTLNLIPAAVVGNVVADPARARTAASLQGGGGESDTQPKWLVDHEKLFVGDTPLVATTVRASQHDAEAIVTNARVAHGRATAAREQALHRDESKCERSMNMEKYIEI